MVFRLLDFSFMFLCLCTVESHFVKSSHRCIPTSIVRGPCHTCVCMLDGLFHCRSDPCNKVQSINSTLRSANKLPEITDGQPCTPGKAYRMECNTCWCSSTSNLVCSKMACMAWPKHKEYRRSKKQGLPELPILNCEPGMLYKTGCQRCFCTDMKVPVCTSKQCKKDADAASPIMFPSDVSPPVEDTVFDNLPKVLHGASDCNPGGTYRWDCNVCICLANGNLLCEQNYCMHMGETNRLAAKKRSGKQCNDTQPIEDECVNCTCNKSGRYTCIPLPDCVPATARRQLHGSHEKFKPKLLFNLDTDTCVPHMVYKVGCNNCYCQEDLSLRCTKKGCLNKIQVKLLMKPGEDVD